MEESILTPRPKGSGVFSYLDNETEKEYTYIYDEIGNVEKEYIDGVLKEYEYLQIQLPVKKQKDEL